MARKPLSKKNRQARIRPAKQGRASPPFSKTGQRERNLEAFHEEHIWVGSYPDARWVSIDEEE